jgi:hypothetical protein
MDVEGLRLIPNVDVQFPGVAGFHEPRDLAAILEGDDIGEEPDARQQAELQDDERKESSHIHLRLASNPIHHDTENLRCAAGQTTDRRSHWISCCEIPMQPAGKDPRPISAGLRPKRGSPDFLDGLKGVKTVTVDWPAALVQAAKLDAAAELCRTAARLLNGICGSARSFPDPLRCH